MEPTKRLFTPTIAVILIAVAVLALGAIGAYFYYFSSPGRYWHAKGQKSGAEATKKAEFDLNEAMRIISENYAYSLVEQPLLDTTGNTLPKEMVKKEEVVVFGEAKTFDWSAGLQFRQIHLIDQTTFRPTGQTGWVTSASLVYFTSPKEAWDWGHRERKEATKKIIGEKPKEEVQTQTLYLPPPSYTPLPLSKKHLEATKLGMNEWEVILSAKDGYSGTGVMVQPGGQVEILVSGQSNIASDRSTDPNGFIPNWGRTKRKSFASWPLDADKFSGLNYLGGAYARLGDFDTFKFIGSRGWLKNNYNQPLELQFAINDDFYFNGEVLHRWLTDNYGGYIFKFKLID